MGGGKNSLKREGMLTENPPRCRHAGALLKTQGPRPTIFLGFFGYLIYLHRYEPPNRLKEPCLP
jgi:hypothetical protein